MIQYSCKKDALPTVKTLPASEISSTTAKSGGDITDDGGSVIDSKGIVWSINSNPTIENHSGITDDGVGKGVFTSKLTDLLPETQYYVRAYATNSSGIAYGDQESFTTTQNYPAGFIHCDPENPTAIVGVINPVTGKTWMDRNLGASRVATSSTDSLAYGDLYQWGRFADGHQCRNSATTTIPSSTDHPGHGDFIITSNQTKDWRSPGNFDLWQGAYGVNNPCPPGYRVPYSAELNAERMSWSSNNASGAFQSPLKLPMAGNRIQDGSIKYAGLGGYYWSSNETGSTSRGLLFDNVDAGMYNNRQRIFGYSVRCIMIN